MTIEEEKQIINNVLGGNKNAFERLVSANQTNVYNLALKMTRNAEDALDISQEVFLKAYQNLQGFRMESRFSVWLYRLTYNLCIDNIRRNKDVHILSLDQKDESGEDIFGDVPDTRNLPEDDVIDAETRAAILDAIDLLPRKYREVLIMREISAVSYEEISRILNINPGTVKSRLARARDKLAKILAQNGTFPAGYRHIEYQSKRKEADKS